MNLINSSTSGHDSDPVISSTPGHDSEELYLSRCNFQSSEELLKNVRAFYSTRGYGLSVRNSKKEKFVILQCDRGGCYRDTRCSSENQRKRGTGTRLVNCPFKITGKKRDDGFWGIEVRNLSHNHEPSSDIAGHPSFRRLASEDVQSVKELTQSGIPPRSILSKLRKENPNLTATSKTIYNLKAKVRKDNLGGRSVVGALFEELEKEGFTYNVLHSPTGHITRLFIAHPLSIKLAKTFPNTFVMDCTYKTNKYNMPLLDIIGVSCFNVFFYSGFAFLEKEDEENYTWALNTFKNILSQESQPSVIMTDRELALMNAIKVVFPWATSLLCVWHIEKNVLGGCKKYFGSEENFDLFMSRWTDVVSSQSEACFSQNWQEFELLYKEKKDALEYIKTTWLPWKEKFVSAWTEQYLHFGNRSSSRAEGAHAKLKMYLQVSTGGLQEVKEKICLAVEHEFNEIKVKLSSERIRVPHNCNIPLFRDLLSRVSLFALKEIYKQYEKLKNGTITPECTGHFKATMGLPCAHIIKNIEGMNTLSLEHVHPHWRIDTRSFNQVVESREDDTSGISDLLKEFHSRYEEWPINKKESARGMISQFVNQPNIFFEPIVQRSKGRPRKSKKKGEGATSTKRQPSKFELVESSRRQNPRSDRVQDNNEALDEMPTNYYNTSTLIDLNAYPDSQIEFMS